MKLLSWNIQGGGRRTAKIIDTLLEADADLVALTEFRLPSSQRIADAMVAAGWRSFIAEPVEGKNRIALFSRVPFELRQGPFPEAPFRHRWLEVQLPSLIVAVVYGPMGEPKPAFWAGLLEAARDRHHLPFILLGDLNTGDSRCDREGSPFNCSEAFVALGQILPDAWRLKHGEQREFTWYSWKRNRAGRNGFRIDHAFVSPSLLPCVVACDYLHAPREQGLSDHSMVALDFRNLGIVND